MSSPSQQDAPPIVAAAEEEEEQQQQQKMASPSQQDAPPIVAAAEEKEEVCKAKQAIPSSSAAAEAQVDELCCLSGDKPFFDIVLSKSYVAYPYSVKLPARAVINLPSGEAQVVITHGNRKWNLSYNGSVKRPTFLTSAWRRFVEDNNLKPDDACIFEVMESSLTAVELKVVFLRKTKCLPPHLRAEIVCEPHGRTAETPIELD